MENDPNMRILLADVADERLSHLARHYNRLQNEGVDGYNPYIEEIDRRERERDAARPKSLEDVRRSMIQKLGRMDCALARESGTYDEAACDDLTRQIAEIDEQIKRDFLTIWDMETTKSRRAEWNARIRAGEFGSKRINYAAVDATERKQGWTMLDLNRAVLLHGI